MIDTPYKNIADGLASLGRYDDNYIVHAAEGETVIPAEVLEANPKLKSSLFKQMQAMGIKDPNRYVVGNELNSINPETGQPEFFFKSIGKLFKKAAPIIGSIVGAQFGPIGAAIGGGLGSLVGGASPEQALVNAGLSFAGGKFFGPMLDKGIANAAGSATAGLSAGPTVGSVLPQGIASTLPSGLSNLGLGTAAAVALAPVIGKGVGSLGQQQEVEEYTSTPSVVSEYYAALERGENPPLPTELVPPPESSLFAQERYVPPPQEERLANIMVDPVTLRPLFRKASYGGYITGPGGPVDDSIPTLLSNTEFVQTGKAVAGADPSGNNNPDEGAKVMMGIMRDFEKRADKNASAMA